jgi:hypothetical protein
MIRERQVKEATTAMVRLFEKMGLNDAEMELIALTTVEGLHRLHEEEHPKPKQEESKWRKRMKRLLPAAAGVGLAILSTVIAAAVAS